MGKQITVLGLGAGDLDQLPLGVYKALKQATSLFLRTKEHPVVEMLSEEKVIFHSFDDVYERHDDFPSVYEEISEILLDKAEHEEITYAVPGHPMIAEKTVQLLLERGYSRGIEVKVIGGQSFLDSFFTAVQMDPIDGFQLLDGTSLQKDDIQINQHLIIAQVYDAFVASEVKLTLMEKYPDDYEVTIVTGAGSQHEQIKRLPLYELDRQVKLDNLTSLYVPPIQKMDLTYKEFSTLRRIITTLRGPNGCPWDKKQTHLSLKKYLIEEAYELLHAIDQDDIDNIVEELGDVLLQIMLHSQIGEEDGMFSIEDVIETLSAKMIRRHPHVFGEEEVANSDEVLVNWEKIKEAEKEERITDQSVLSEVDKGLPALINAYEYQKRAAKVGFDWEKADEAFEKVQEELQEFQVELAKGNKQEQMKELGDLLFSIVNVSRLLNIHPEEALQTSNEKFLSRFSYVEKKVKESGKPFKEYSLDQLDAFWNEAKKKR
ncbi:bifunctional methyltransferase/pyrophosphohydrolase YabN [Bacillus niameyensis]|uniref:nucleoside triphosphate pyrophosphohydrolase n=1 Tax=Bacillus niameyensis TaxID=1522308 RepID=UPI000780F16C|nr:nucleoside triphosphate pyrophosphohydrolase [Bacillus niameyensis]